MLLKWVPNKIQHHDVMTSQKGQELEARKSWYYFKLCSIIITIWSTVFSLSSLSLKRGP